jgi:hypothetical protein
MYCGEITSRYSQPARVLERGLRIVDRARADHDREAVVEAVQDRVQRTPRGSHGERHRLVARQLGDELRGRGERGDVADA